jgi:hypothetical protein
VIPHRAGNTRTPGELTCPFWLETSIFCKLICGLCANISVVFYTLVVVTGTLCKLPASGTGLILPEKNDVQAASLALLAS